MPGGGGSNGASPARLNGGLHSMGSAPLPVDFKAEPQGSGLIGGGRLPPPNGVRSLSDQSVLVRAAGRCCSEVSQQLFLGPYLTSTGVIWMDTCLACMRRCLLGAEVPCTACSRVAAARRGRQRPWTRCRCCTRRGRCSAAAAAGLAGRRSSPASPPWAASTPPTTSWCAAPQGQSIIACSLCSMAYQAPVLQEAGR